MPCQMWLLLLSAFVLTFVTVDADCQSGYSSYNNKTCYKVYTSMKTRAAAEVQCESDGGYLASPSNGFDNSYVLSLGQKASVSSMWLGIECFDGKKSECGNDDETTFGPYDNFYTNNPSTVGNCVYMSTVKPAVGSWLSFNCLNSLPFVCEQDFGSSDNQPQCLPLFSYFKGMCYQVVPELMVLRDAQKKCQQLGGDIATVPSAEVNQYLYGLTAPFDQMYIWIGLYCPNVAYQTDTSSCVWLDNAPVKYLNFDNFSPTNGYPYTTLRNDTLWRNNTGYGNYYFICEAIPTQPVS